MGGGEDVIGGFGFVVVWWGWVLGGGGLEIVVWFEGVGWDRGGEEGGGEVGCVLGGCENWRGEGRDDEEGDGVREVFYFDVGKKIG